MQLELINGTRRALASSFYRLRSLIGATAGGGGVSESRTQTPPALTGKRGAAVPLYQVLFEPTCSPNTCTGQNYGAGQITVRRVLQERNPRRAESRRPPESTAHELPAAPPANSPVRPSRSGSLRHRPEKGPRQPTPHRRARSPVGASPKGRLARRLGRRRRRTHRPAKAMHAADWPALE